MKWRNKNDFSRRFQLIQSRSGFKNSKEFALFLGRNYQEMQRYENALRLPNADSMAAIANAISSPIEIFDPELSDEEAVKLIAPQPDRGRVLTLPSAAKMLGIKSKELRAKKKDLPHGICWSKAQNSCSSTIFFENRLKEEAITRGWL